MQPVIDFLASFEPKDWATSTLALAAIVVSVVSLAMKVRSAPRPFFTVAENRLYDNDGAGRPYWELRITNHGNAEARDIAFTKPAELEMWDSHMGSKPVLLPGESLAIKGWLTESEGNSYAIGSVDVRSVRAVLSWRQAPNFGAVRRQTFKATEVEGKKPKARPLFVAPSVSTKRAYER